MTLDECLINSQRVVDPKKIKEFLKNVPEEDHGKLVTALIQKEFKSSLYKTAKLLTGYNDITLHTHGPIIKILESPNKRKLIVVPRGCFKSSLCSVAYPIWRLINDPNDRILITSQLFTNSKMFIREIRTHLENERATNYFGKFKGPHWNDSALTIWQRNRTYKEPSIKAGGIGTTLVGAHYKCIVFDDINSQDNTATPELAIKAIEYYRHMQAILEPDGTIVVVGTRYSQLDLVQFILDKEVNIDPREGLIDVNSKSVDASFGNVGSV